MVEAEEAGHARRPRRAPRLEERHPWPLGDGDHHAARLQTLLGALASATTTELLAGLAEVAAMAEQAASPQDWTGRSPAHLLTPDELRLRAAARDLRAEVDPPPAVPDLVRTRAVVAQLMTNLAPCLAVDYLRATVARLREIHRGQEVHHVALDGEHYLVVDGQRQGQPFAGHLLKVVKLVLQHHPQAVSYMALASALGKSNALARTLAGELVLRATGVFERVVLEQVGRRKGGRRAGGLALAAGHTRR